ncbi:putative GEM-like protein 8 [Zea mays]|uniref:Putative GEM-like protein 8 n=1 Tax=Zea mays TaxID=4577 RepID=A0A3L6F1V1_MAIZE|nr:putative GEM-like protein 8 [Zea mays]
MEGSTATEGHVVGIPVSTRAYGIEEPDFSVEETTPDRGEFPSSFQYYSHDAASSTTTAADRPTSNQQATRKRDKIVRGIKEHVTLGPKLSDTVKGKLSLGAKILRAGGSVEKLFRQWFSADKDEKLLRASQCHLWTTAGPIAGVLFVSTARVAFRSDRSLSLAVSTPRGDCSFRAPYKVAVPLRKVGAVRPSENRHRPDQRYVRLATTDGFEFWFMGFVSYNKSLQHLERAVACAR